MAFCGAGDVQRLGAVHGVHGLQKTGQPQHMIAVIMGQRDHVNAHGVDMMSVEGQLGAFAAVEQDIPSSHGKHRAAQSAVRLGKGGGGSEQGDGQHGSTSGWCWDYFITFHAA